MERIVKDCALTYAVYEKYIQALKERYPFINVTVCGETLLGKKIYALVIGSGKENVLYTGGTHGTEWLTSLMLLKFSENLLKAYENKTEIAGYDVRELLSKRTLIVVPEVNPDGIEISQKGESACGCYKDICIKACGGDFSIWNANARGVDINHNFDAEWVRLHDLEEKEGIIGAAPRQFGGNYPESEPETAALTRVCREIDLRHVIAFHSEGEEIYWYYGNNTPKKSLTMAKIFSALTEYTLVKNEAPAVGGGFKDWFIYETGKPAFTVEIGRGKNPLPLWELSPVYDTVIELLIMGLVL